MYKIFGFLNRKPGLTMAEFITYYEEQHIALVGRLAPAPLVYRRRYITRETPLGRGAAPVDFDCMTELGFADRAAYVDWMRRLFGPESGGVVAADEERFIDRARTRGYAVEEYVTAG